MTQNKHTKLYIRAVLLVLGAVALDQLTKYLAVVHLKGKEAFVLWKGVFELHYLENSGAAFGILQNQKWFFLAAGCLIILLVTCLFIRLPFTRKFAPMRLACILIVAGALGNMIDRALHRYVIDFFYFKLIDFPIFNVADIYVTVTTAVILLMVLFYYKEEDLDELFAVFHRKSRREDTHE